MPSIITVRDVLHGADPVMICETVDQKPQFVDEFPSHTQVFFNWFVMSSIYGSRSYMKWQYDGVRHGTSAGKHWEIAFRVLTLL